MLTEQKDTQLVFMQHSVYIVFYIIIPINILLGRYPAYLMQCLCFIYNLPGGRGAGGFLNLFLFRALHVPTLHAVGKEHGLVLYIKNVHRSY